MNTKMESEEKKFGTLLKMYRDQKGYSQKGFAEALGITPTRLNYWENNKAQPNVEMIKKIATVLEVNTNDLIGLSNTGDDSSIQKGANQLTRLVWSASDNKKKLIQLILEMPDELLDGMIAYLQSVHK